MLVSSSDCGCDAKRICYDREMIMKCVQDKLSITWDLPGIGETLPKFR
jgi:hypothetical protein